jgi:hypothetical protein
MSPCAIRERPDNSNGGLQTEFQGQSPALSFSKNPSSESTEAEY